jgi:hypothetical protein
MLGIKGKNPPPLTKRSVYTYDIFDRWVVKSYDSDGGGSTVPTLSKWLYDGQNPVLEFKDYNPSGSSSDSRDGLTHRYLYGNLVD